MNPQRILLAGDSIMAGRIPHSGTDEGIGLSLALPAALRLAVSGSTALEWADDTDNRLTRACATLPSDVVVSLLANDVFRAMSDGSVSDEESAVSLAAFGYVVRRLRLAHPRVFCTLYQDPFFGARPDVAAGVGRMNRVIAAVAASCGCGVFDMPAFLRPEHYDGRDIHPSQAGYAAAASGLLTIL